jgi:hypothetical protein
MASSTYINLATNPDTPQQARNIDSAPGSSSSNEGTTTTSASNSSFVHVSHPNRAKGRTSEIAPTASSSRGTSVVRQTEGRASFLGTGDLDGDDVHDNGPWAENGTWWSAVASENVDEVKEGIQAIEKAIKEGHLSEGELAVSSASPCDGCQGLTRTECQVDTGLPPFFNRRTSSGYTDRRRARKHAGCQNRSDHG